MDEAERNRARVLRGFEDYNAHDGAAYRTMYADPVVWVDANTGDRREVHAAEATAEDEAFRAAFPDHRCEIQTIVAAGDRVLVRYVNHGTYTNPDPGITPVLGDPIGRSASWAAVSDYRFRDGVVVEVAVVNDTRAMIRQLTSD